MSTPQPTRPPLNPVDLFQIHLPQMMAGVKEKMGEISPEQMAEMARSMGMDVNAEQMAQVVTIQKQKQ